MRYSLSLSLALSLSLSLALSLSLPPPHTLPILHIPVNSTLASKKSQLLTPFYQPIHTPHTSAHTCTFDTCDIAIHTQHTHAHMDNQKRKVSTCTENIVYVCTHTHTHTIHYIILL